MRSPVIIGVLAALALGFLVLALLLGAAIAEPPRAPSPTAPTAPPIALPSPEPTASPAATASPDAPATPGALPTGDPTDPPSGGIGLGEPAPRIELPALGGGTFDTAQWSGQPLWINFMATWCPQCVDELPMMELMQDQLSEDLQIVIVDVGEDEEVVAEFMQQLDVSLPVGIDRDSDVQAEWGAWALPVHFWLDEEGVIKSILFGGAPRDAFVDSVLNVVPDAQLD